MGTQSSLCEDHLMRPNHCPSLSVPGLPAPPSPTDLCVTKDIENHPASQVTPFLFIGNMKDASDAAGLTRLGVDHVLNVTAVSPVYDMSETITYKQLHAADNGYQNLKSFPDRVVKSALVDNLQWDAKEQEKTPNSPWSSTSSSSSWSSTEDSSVQPGCGV